VQTGCATVTKLSYPSVYLYQYVDFDVTHMVVITHLSFFHLGGRGLLREVWTGFSFLDGVEGRPRAENTSPQERAYRDEDSPREFGERYNFVQRFSGFFVPPLTSLYTFVIRSDDHSRLYLSPNVSDEHKQLIAYAPQYTRRRWNYFPTQTAAPILLEAGKAYYMEAISNQGGGPWDLGISAKIHNLSFNTYPFNGDNEVQMISIFSVVVKEEHVSALVSMYSTVPKSV